MKCDFCGADESLPFVCNYCGGAFCAEHRLPEAHQCKGDLTQRRTMVPPTQTTFSWQTPPAATYPSQARRSVYSKVEVRDIFVAWLALGVAFALALGGGGISVLSGGNSAGTVLVSVVVSLITVGPGFVFHELSHKFVAQRNGFWAEFRVWPMWLGLALIMSLLSPLIFAAPGATYIAGENISKEQNGRISVAGPLVNIVIGTLFLALAVFSSSGFLGYVGSLGAYVNFWLAAFNLIPFGPLDGSKVLRWNFLVWLVTFIPSLVVVFFFLGFL